MKELQVNNCNGVLGASISSTATSLTVSGTGSQFPATGNFRLILSGSDEIMLCTSRSGATLTVARGQEGTTASSHTVGETIAVVVTAGSQQSYGRDNDPYWDGSRSPFALLDASGNTLTSASFSVLTPSGQVKTPVVSDSDRRISILQPAGQNVTSAEALCSLVRSAPATPYTVQCAIDVDCISDTSGRCSAGVGFRKSSTGVSLLLRLPLVFGSRDEFSMNQFTNEASDSFVANVDYPVVGSRHYFKFEDDGTNLTWWWSASGVNWIQVYQTARTYFTGGPDQIVAMAAGANQTPYDFYTSLLQYSE